MVQRQQGFGFVKLTDGTEAYLHIRVLEAAGSRDVSEGARLNVVIEAGSRGRQVAQVLAITDPIARTPARGGRADVPIAATTVQIESAGTVKWYNAEKGFGFIAPENGEKDVFVHATALTRAGLRVLEEGQKVFIECGPGKKGPEVRSIRLA
ncbi:MAG: cold-shock protein [Rhizobiaceae bacterium]